MDNEIEYKLPLGLCKQAVMKLDSFMTDINEIKEDENLNEEDREVFETIKDMTGAMMAAIVNIVTREIDEDEFLNENITMDEIQSYPGDDINILDEDI